MNKITRTGSLAVSYTHLDVYNIQPEGCEILSLGTTKQSVFDSICNLNLDSFVAVSYTHLRL